MKVDEIGEEAMTLLSFAAVQFSRTGRMRSTLGRVAILPLAAIADEALRRVGSCQPTRFDLFVSLAGRTAHHVSVVDVRAGAKHDCAGAPDYAGRTRA
jgi:hypothetical protein